MKNALDIMQSQDQDKIRRHQDLERIKAEVRASMNNEANEYVHQEIARAHTQMYAEIDRQVKLKTGADTQLEVVDLTEEIPMSQNRN